MNYDCSSTNIHLYSAVYCELISSQLNNVFQLSHFQINIEYLSLYFHASKQSYNSSSTRLVSVLTYGLILAHYAIHTWLCFSVPQQDEQENQASDVINICWPLECSVVTPMRHKPETVGSVWPHCTHRIMVYTGLHYCQLYIHKTIPKVLIKAAIICLLKNGSNSPYDTWS